MVLKLEMTCTDDVGQKIHKASIVKWHKKEGDAVDYGDDLFDMKVDEVLVSWAVAPVIHENKRLDRRPSDVAELAFRQLSGEEAPRTARTAPKAGAEDGFPVPWVFFLRFKSAEKGYLKKIYSREMETLNAGLPVALLTTDPTEAVDQHAGPPAGAAAFRFETSLMEPDPALVLQRVSKPAVRQEQKAEQQSEVSGKNFLTFWSEDPPENRIGIYMKGGCDLNMIYACKPLIHPHLKGACAVLHEGLIADSRSDLLLQTLQGLPPDLVEPVVRKLYLPPDCFQPQLFEKTFKAPGLHGTEEFPKNVIILSNTSDVTRSVYRHREHGYLIDPGGGWLSEPLDYVLSDLSAVTWFRKTFESVGKISLEESIENYTRIIKLLKQNTDAHILVFNILTIEPGSKTHNYQFVRNSQTIRRLEFNLALQELSRKLDFWIVDVDRILKKLGIRTQLDWNHSDPKVHLLIAREAFRIMQECGVFGKSPVAPGGRD